MEKSCFADGKLGASRNRLSNRDSGLIMGDFTRFFSRTFSWKFGRMAFAGVSADVSCWSLDFTRLPGEIVKGVNEKK